MKEGMAVLLFTLLLASTLSPAVITAQNMNDILYGSKWDCEDMSSTMVKINHPDGEGFTCAMSDWNRNIWSCKNRGSEGVYVFSPNGSGFRCPKGYQGMSDCTLAPSTRVQGFVPDGAGFFGYVDSRETWGCIVRPSSRDENRHIYPIEPENRHTGIFPIEPVAAPRRGSKLFIAGGMNFSCLEDWTCVLLSTDLQEPPSYFSFDFPHGPGDKVECSVRDGRNWICQMTSSSIFGPSCKSCHVPNKKGHCKKVVKCEQRRDSWPFFR